MASDPAILEASGVRQITLAASQTTLPGTLLGYSTGWKLADADARIPAVLMAMEAGVGGQVIKACRAGVLYDADAPFTDGSYSYLSATAGAYTETSPTAGATLTIIQKIGFAISTSELEFSLVPGTGPLYLVATQSIDLANITATTSLETAVTITGVLTTDVPILCIPASLHNDLVPSGLRVSAADTVQLRMTDIDNTNAIDDSARTYVFHFIRPN